MLGLLPAQYYDDAAGILRMIILSACQPHRLMVAPPQPLSISDAEVSSENPKTAGTLHCACPRLVRRHWPSGELLRLSISDAEASSRHESSSFWAKIL